jgi:TP901 family phage tail tape measure protein
MAGEVSIGKIVGTVELEDHLTPVLQKVDRALQANEGRFDRLGDTLDTFGGRTRAVGSSIAYVGDRITLLSAATVAAGAGVLKLGNNFETNMVRLVTVAGVSEQAMQKFRGEVLQLAPAVGKAPAELSKALYGIASVGMRGAEAMEILERSAKASAIGLGETEAVARAVVGAMTAYGKDTLSAAKATDILHAAVVEGGAEARDFAQTLGRITGIASLVGISFEEVTSSIATFTRLGVRADEAVTALRGTMAFLMKPAAQSRDMLLQMGTSIQEVRDKVKKDGLASALIELTRLTNGNEEAMGRIIPNFRALAGVLANTGEQAEEYRNILFKVTHASGNLDEAFTRLSETAQQKLNRAWAQVLVLGVQAGEKLAPAVISIAQSMMPLVEIGGKMVNAFAALPQPLQTTAVGLVLFAAAMGPVLSVGGRLVEVIGFLIGSRGIGGIAKLATQMELAGSATIAFTAIKRQFLAVVLASQINISLLMARMGIYSGTLTALGSRVLIVSGATNLLAASKARLIPLLLAAQINFSLLLARMGIYAGAASAAATATTAFGASLLSAAGAVAAVVLPVTALLAALGAIVLAAPKAGEGLKNMWHAMRSGDWSEITKQDTTGALYWRNLLGMQKEDPSANKGRAEGQAAMSELEQLSTRMQGLDLKNKVNDLALVYGKLREAGKVTPDILLRIAKEAEGLAKAGAKLPNSLQSIVRAQDQVTLGAEGAARGINPFTRAIGEVDSALKGLSATTRKELTLGANNFDLTAFKEMATRIPEAAGLSEQALEKFYKTVHEGSRAAAKEMRWLDQFRNGARVLEAELTAAEKAGVPMTVMVEEFGNQIDKVTNRAPMFGDAIGAATQRAHQAMVDMDLATWTESLEAANRATRMDLMEEGIRRMEKFGDVTLNNLQAISASKRAIEDMEPQVDTLATRLANVSKEYERQIEDIPIADRVGLQYQNRLKQIGKEADAAAKMTARAWLDGNTMTRASLQMLADDALDRYLEMSRVGQHTPQDIYEAWLTYHNLQIKLIGDWKLSWASALESIGQSFGGFIGKTISGLGRVLQAWDAATKAAILYKAQGGATGAQKTQAVLGGIGEVYAATGSESTPANLVGGALAGASAGASIGAAFAPGTMGISIIVGAVAGLIVGAVRSAMATTKYELGARAAKQSFMDLKDEMGGAFGSIDNLRREARLFGVEVDDALTWNASGDAFQQADNLKRAIDDLKARTELLNSAMQEYGLTWVDLNEEFKKSRIAEMSDNFIKKFNALGAAGVPMDKILVGAAESLNKFIAESLVAGVKIPAALGPVIKQLIEMGLLSEANARAMLGLSAASTITFAQVEEAAKRYGIEIDSLGPKITQLQITETANQVVRDFDLLQAAGADTGAVINGMSDEVQDLVNKALKYGLELPIGLKPIAQAMIDAGLLTDETGEKMTDLGRLNFVKPLSASIDELIAKLDELISKITDGVGGALTSLPQLPGGRERSEESTETGTSENRSSGGLVGSGAGSRVLKFVARGSDTIPAMLTPGELVLNKAQQENVAAAMMNPSPANSAQGMHQVIHFHTDGRETAKIVIPYFVEELELRGIVNG